MLNNTQIKNLKSSTKTSFYHDSNGLFLVISPKGKKSFYHKSRTHKKKLGDYPNISLKEARFLNKELKSKQNLKANYSFESGFIKWLDFAYKNSPQKMLYNNAFKRYFADVGALPLADIKRPHLIQSLQNMGDKYETGKRFLACLKRFFDWAEMNEYITQDPAYKLKISNIIKPSKTKHFPTLQTSEEITDLIDKIYSTKSNLVAKTMTLLVFFTAVRTSTARFAKWADFDLNKGIWDIKAEDMKTKKAFKVYLHPCLIGHLKALKSITHGVGIVFPSVNYSLSDHVSPQTLRKFLLKMGYDNNVFVPHGFRALFSTFCNELSSKHGLSFEIIELCLAHVDKNTIRRIYNRSSHEEEKAKLWQWWGDYLISLNARLLTPLY